MQRALNYEKYFNMTKEQLRASLARATQKEKSKMAEFFNEVLSDDEILNDKSLNGEILDDDEKSYPLDEVPVIQRADAFFASLPKKEQERIKAEVRAQMGLK
ncbi:hypothetical protein CINF_0302 [Candidatus Campylobacter infans]|uniref:Uncharacterized protein n=1 Tax=Candidatus Campylobacter infans TaxID=2561898 RepID=A0A7H9CJD5_9BACT|nr:hypothetical protein [Candidatus Campylobacter infans]QLI04849.1 hypothetical protein CINF_0302 [Candidatus Campylobacter infans]